MKYIVLITALFFGWNNLYSQENANTLKLLISSRIDTSSHDVKAIIGLYENYYSSRPDSIYDNTYWNKKEKALYKDFDFSRASIFQGGLSANDLFNYYSPFLMSVEEMGEKYQIRVLFSSATKDPKYAGSKVWCIQKLSAIKENGAWVLENSIVELSKHWSSKQQGFIEYIYPPNHSFDAMAAESAETFCNEIIQRFNPDFKESFKYFVTSNIDDMGLLENFDYYFVGISTGKAREGMILTAKGNEHYPHEFVHKLLPVNENRGYVIEEGIATYLGTKQNKEEYEARMNKLATDLTGSAELINFESVLSQTVRFNGYQTAYPAGAGICELVFEMRGDQGLSDLLSADTQTFDGIVNAVCLITNLTEGEVEAKWNEILKKYSR